MADHGDHGGSHGGGGHGEGHDAGHGGGGKGGGHGGSKGLGAAASGLSAVVVGIAFVVVLISTIVHGFQPTGATYAPVDRKAQMESQCDGSTRVVPVGSSPVIINPGALCTMNFDVENGPIELSGPLGNATIRPGEDRDYPDLWFETARAVDGHAVLSYQLVQP